MGKGCWQILTEYLIWLTKDLPQCFYPLGHEVCALVCLPYHPPVSTTVKPFTLNRIWICLSLCWSCNDLHSDSSVPEGHECRGMDTAMEQLFPTFFSSFCCLLPKLSRCLVLITSCWLQHFFSNFSSLVFLWLLSAISVASWLPSCFWPEACKVNAVPVLEERLVEWMLWQWHLPSSFQKQLEAPQTFSKVLQTWLEDTEMLSDLCACCLSLLLALLENSGYQLLQNFFPFLHQEYSYHFKIHLPFKKKKKKWGQRGE